MIPVLASAATTPRVTNSSTRTMNSMISMVATDRYTINSITTMTPTVIPVTFCVLLLPTSNESVSNGAMPVTWAFTPGGAGVVLTMSRMASTDALDLASP